MAKRKIWSVEPRPNGRWAVQRDGTRRADSLHDGKQAAIRRGIELGRRNCGQLRVKGRNGRVQDERTYGGDPRSVAG